MQLLSSTLPGVTLRFSRLADSAGVVDLFSLEDITDDGIPALAVRKSARAETAEDVAEMMQTSRLTVTALVTDPNTAVERVAGFLSLAAGPRAFREAAPAPAPPVPDPTLPADRWDDALHSGLYAGSSLAAVQPSNTLWLALAVAPSSAALERLFASEDGGSPPPPLPAYTAARLLREMLTVLLSVAHRTAHVLCALPAAGPAAAAAASERLLREALGAVPIGPGGGGGGGGGGRYAGTLLHVHRGGVIPALAVRPGRIEDYDDLVPLLVAGAGVITELPNDFFLEEVLKGQNATHRVTVAENPVTHEVMGLACAHLLSPEEQQYFTKQYALEPVNKLRPSAAFGRDGARRAGGGAAAATVRLDFLYFNDAYNGSAHELIKYVFEHMFPSCEYILVMLPHAIEEPPILKSFTYLPIRQYQPHNSRGEFVAVPPGLWVCCRHSTLGVEAFSARVVRTAQDVATAEEFLQLPTLYDLSADTAQRLIADLRLPHGDEAAAPQLPDTPVLQLFAGGGAGGPVSVGGGGGAGPVTEVAGLVSVRRMTARDLYALKANYDLDQYVSLYTRTGRNYTATDVAVTDAAAERHRAPPELNGVVIRAMYVRPMYRSWVRFLVGEVLRQCGADVAVTLTQLEDEPCVALMHEMIRASPRRVVEENGGPAAGDEGDDGCEEGCPACEADSAGMATASTEVTGQAATLASLHFTTARFLGDEKRRIHSRVVIVGASATGLSVAHTLLSTPFARFTNLALVSTDGLPPHANQEPTLWAADHVELMEREFLVLQQGSPMRTVTGAMVDLDKVNKFISVDNGTFEPYDHLILATGRQHVLPPSVRQLLVQEGRTGKKSIIPLNGDLALDRARQVLAQIDLNVSNVSNVMVYGSGLNAIAVAAAMVKENFSSQRIVVCARDEGLPSGMDEATYHATATLLRSMGLNAFRGFDVSRMEFDDDNNLCSVMLAPVSPDSQAGQAVEIACCLVLCVEDKDIDANVLSALNKRSIVIDGRVIVNRRYRTTDPCVLAAGPVAMWTRRYGTVTPNFEDFSAKDVGRHLAQVLLGHLGFAEFRRIAACAGRDGTAPGSPLSDDDGDDVDKDDDDDDDEDGAGWNTSGMGSTGGPAGGDTHRQLRKRLPTYTTPIARRLRLPGGYHFFCVHRVDAALAETCDALSCDTVDTTRFLDFSPVQSPSSDGSGAAAAGAGQTDQCIIIVYVNRGTRRIDGVTYFGLEEPQSGNYAALVGLPESVLNLEFRYREAQQRAAAATATVGVTAPCTAADEAASSADGSAAPAIDLPAHSGLTAGVCRGQLDLVAYLRLPHLQSIFYDRFTDFFRRLERRTRRHADALAMRARILADHTLEGSLTPAETAAYQAQLTALTATFNYDVQLALIAFLHENKNFRPHNMFLPGIDRALAAKRSGGGSGEQRRPLAATLTGSGAADHGVTADPMVTIR